MKISVLALMLTIGSLAAAAATPSPPAQMGRQLIAVLQSDSPLFERVQACRQLAIIGGEESVPALAALLPDEALSHYAREALEAMPHPAAGAALRGSLPTLKGHLLVGAVNSLGMRRDADAVETLTHLADDSDLRVAAAALIALGRIGGSQSSRVLQGALGRGRDDLRDHAAEGCLLAADRHRLEGRRDAAVSLYDAVRRAPVAAQLRATATRGAIIARGVAGLSLLIEQLHSQDISLCDVALASVRDLPDPEVTASLVAELEQAEPGLQVRLISALVDRAGSRVLGAVEAKAMAPSEEVRIVALEALGQIGRDSSLPLLLQAIRAPSGRESAAAFDSLSRIAAPETQAEILKILPSVDSALRVKLISVIGERNAAGAAAELLRLAVSSDVDSSKASLRALAVVARPEDLPELTRMAVAMPDQERRTLAARALVTAAVKVPEAERRADLVLAQFRQTTDAETKISLLLPLGAIVRSTGGNDQALRVVTSALTDTSERVRDTALRTLVNWPDAAAGMPLVEFATRSDATPTQREDALRGAIRMAANVVAGRDPSPLDPLALFRKVDRIVRTKDEKLLLVSSLANFKRIEAVQILQRYLDDPTVQTQAALAVAQIAPALLHSERGAEIKQVLERIAATSNPKPVAAGWELNRLDALGGQAPKVLGEPRPKREGLRSAICFDGKGDGLIVPVNPVAGWPAFTIEVLFKPDPDGLREQRFVHLQDADENRALIETRITTDRQWYLDTYLFARRTQANLTLVDPSKKHACGQWYWAALVYDGKKMSHFVNGVKEREGEVAFPAMVKGQTSLGVRLNQVFWFKGCIAAVWFHPSALETPALQRETSTDGR